MKLNAVRVFVSDLAAAKAFYAGTLGLPLAWEDATAIGFDAGATLIVELNAGDEPGLVGRFVGISLEVADVAAAYEALRARGVSFVAAPEVQPWGGVLAHFEDPLRNVLTLVG